jgi:hypothetical protein
MAGKLRTRRRRSNIKARSARSRAVKGSSGSTQDRKRTGARPDPLQHAVDVIRRVCCLAGATNLLDEIRAELRAEGIATAIRRHDTGTLFDWLMAAFSYQGISDRVASSYMAQHGRVHWADIEAKLAAKPLCPKLETYWHFYNCHYEKGRKTCAEPELTNRCPLPGHPLRNGRLNQTAYSLYFFIRDIAGGDLVAWIDRQLQRADQADEATRPDRLVNALINPLRHVYGVSDKILMMALSSILLAAPRGREVWVEAGGHMIAIDTLVHNFLHRTGILSRFGADHAYGAACYGPSGCAAIVARTAQQIDARAFNPKFPAICPRWVQHAIWRFCAQLGLDVCNGNRINDRKSCENIYCQIRSKCDRISLLSL